MASRKFGELVAGVLSQTEAAGDPRELTQHLARLCGLDVDGERPATLADQRTLHTSVCRFIEALARSQPLCLLFEDLHWADEALVTRCSLRNWSRQSPSGVEPQASHQPSKP